MRAVYAAHLNFAQGVSIEEVVRAAGRWPARGRAPREAGETWEVGRHSFELPDAQHSLTTEVLEAPDGRLWEATWRHPHQDDAELHMVNDITVADSRGSVTASLVIRTVWSRPRVAVPQFAMAAPRLVRDLLDTFEVHDAGLRLTRQPHRLDAARVDDFVGLLYNPARTRPVVLVSDDPRAMRPLVDPDGLARELAGLAHVFFTVYGQPAAVLSRQLGDLGCRNGAMRIWWPGLTADADPYRHRLYSPATLRDWRRDAAPIQHLFRLVSVAAVTNAAPQAHTALRRASRRAQLEAATDANELTEIAEDALKERDKLEEKLTATEEARELLMLEREDDRQTIQQLKGDLNNMARLMAEAGAETASDSVPEAADDDAGPEPPATVLDAVTQAQPRCPHLSFADRAFTTAEDSPYEFPDQILDDLLKLERLAALWARPEGIGGMDLGQKATELGLNWKPAVSGTAIGGNRGREYEFLWRGERRVMGPHIREDHGSGAGRVARIYLDKHEPEEPTDRLLIVAHVGRKLADTTTG